jgi:tripartite-type tricarboxylate transporter receptor subunit TctC
MVRGRATDRKEVNGGRSERGDGEVINRVYRNLKRREESMKRGCALLVISIVTVGMLGWVNLTEAKDYPARPVQIVVAFGAGGSTSMSARIVAQAFTQVLEQAFVVVNKPGAGGAIGAAFASKAKPDGYTLFVFNSASNGVTPAINPNPGFKNADFQLVGQYAIGECAMVVKADSPWKTVKEVIDHAKKNPGALKFPAGTGDSARFSTELFMMEAGGLKMDRVPVESGAEFSQMLLGGHAQVGVTPAADIFGLVQAGKLRLLAFSNEERNGDFPEIPTFKEAGLPGVLIHTWYGLAVPKGVPDEIMNKLRETLATVMKDPAIKGMLKNMGNTPSYKNAEDFGAFVKHMDGIYDKIAKAGNIRVK